MVLNLAGAKSEPQATDFAPDMEAQAMSIEARIRELGNRHASLDETLRQEMSRPATDSLRVRELKQQKLRLKEEINSLEARTH